MLAESHCIIKNILNIGTTDMITYNILYIYIYVLYYGRCVQREIDFNFNRVRHSLCRAQSSRN